MLQFMGSQRVGHGRATELNLTNSWSLLKLVSIESVIPFNHLVFQVLAIMNKTAINILVQVFMWT